MSTPSFKLDIAGSDVSQTLNLVSLESEYSFNDISFARIQIASDSAANGNLTESLDAKIKEGETIKISIGDQDDTSSLNPVFVGIIIGIGLRITPQNVLIEITCAGEEVRLLHHGFDQAKIQPSSGKAISDSDVIKSMCNDLGVPVKKIGASSIEHSQLSLVHQSVWNFVKQRSFANGFLIIPSQDGLLLDKPENINGNAHALDSDQIISGHLYTDIRRQIGQIQAGRFDVKTQKNASLIKGSAKSSQSLPLKPDAAASALKQKDAIFYTHSQFDDAALTGVSSSHVLYRELDLYQGYLDIDGMSDIYVGDTIKIEKFSDRFDGTYVVSGTRQRLNETGWKTRLHLGKPWYRSSKSSTLLNSGSVVDGLLIGIVQEFQEDPLKLYRFPVKIPALGDKNNIFWARWGSPYASAKSGLFLPPKANDEVIIGCFGGDLSDPVILAAMHNPKNTPPYPIDKETNIRGLLFEPDKAALTYASKETLFKMAQGEKISLALTQDSDMTLTQDKQVITLDTGITVNSDGALLLESGKDITAQASQGKINLKATKTQVD